MRVNSYVPSQKIFEADKASNSSSTTNGVESFADVLSNSIDAINDSQVTSEKMNTAFVSGDDVQISDVMLAGEEAKISLQFAVQIRNKLVDAYKELTNIQI
jgi:flagellar hook-basal body complex protein FliE